MGAPVYTTREQVKTALDSVETARNNRKIDRAIRGGSQAVERLTLRQFYPTVATRTFDWPDPDGDRPLAWRLWLERNTLATSAGVTVVSGGDTLTAGEFFLRPDDGPPYDRVEINLGSSGSWSSGPSSPQRAISVAGSFGYAISEDTGPAIAADMTSGAPSCNITASGDVGVGSLIRIGTERMNVTRRTMLTTGQTLQLPVDALMSTQAIRVTTGTAFALDETIMLDSEKMRVDEITGNTLTVTRAWDGSTLAAHTGSTIYAPRTLTVERGQCGSTAAEHTTGDTVMIFRFPPLIEELALAEALVTLEQTSSAYARTSGAGDNERETAGRAISDLRARVKRAFYRPRTGAV